MKTTKLFGFGLMAATVALGLFAAGASAQQPPPAPAAPAKVLPKTAPPPPAVKALAPAPVAPKAAVAKAADPSPCKGLVEAACKTKADVCGWIVPKKLDAKTGTADKAYCRKVAGIAKKVDPAAKAVAPKVDPKAAVKAIPPAAKVTPPPAATK